MRRPCGAAPRVRRAQVIERPIGIGREPSTGDAQTTTIRDPLPSTRRSTPRQHLTAATTDGGHQVAPTDGFGLHVGCEANPSNPRPRHRLRRETGSTQDVRRHLGMSVAARADRWCGRIGLAQPSLIFADFTSGDGCQDEVTGSCDGRPVQTPSRVGRHRRDGSRRLAGPTDSASEHRRHAAADPPCRRRPTSTSPACPSRQTGNPGRATRG